MKPETFFMRHDNHIPADSVTKPFQKGAGAGTLVIISLALVVITLAVYLQVGNHQFLNFDDDVYVTNNPHVASGMTARNILWAFTSVDAANWHPITWLSHMADVQLYGMDPHGHHLTNVYIHTVSALLLLLLLIRLSGAVWPSAFVAAMFALHPLHVESVAWVAERKDVLSGLFWFLTLLLYCAYVAKRKLSLYLLSLISFVLGLMSKPMLVTLPLVMLLIDYWPLGRFRCGEQGVGLGQISSRGTALFKEKIPFFLCSLLSGIVTIYAQQNSTAMRSLEEISFWPRIENALIAYVKYIANTFWPHDLAILYPFPSYIPLWQVIGSLLILLFLSVAIFRSKDQQPYLVLGWLWFLVTLIPVIGLVQVGGQSMADRYSYIPLTGLFIMAAWGVWDLLKGVKYRQSVLALLAGVVIIASAALTWQQLGHWQDNGSLYRHTLRVTPDNFMINYNLGLALQADGNLDAAVYQYREVLRINPNHAGAHNNLGSALAIKGDLDAAIKEFQETLRIRPNNTRTRSNLERALAQKRLQEKGSR